MNMLDDDRQKYKLGKIVKGLTKGSEDIDDIIGSMSKKELKNLSPLEKEQLLDMQIERYGVDAFRYDADDIDDILKNMSPEEMAGLSDADIDMLLDMEMSKSRKKKADGGSLMDDDREQYKFGKLVSKAGQALSELPDVARDTIDVMKMKMKGDMSQAEKIKLTEDMYKDSVKNYVDLKKSLKKATSIEEEDAIREMLDQEGELISEFTMRLNKMGVTPSMKNLREEKKIPQRIESAEGGMPNETNSMLQSDTMAPDDVMEDEYLDFVLEEALSEEEQSFLMEQLQTNTQLAMIFDKVIDVAQEFAGSGPVEGPGSGVSDSIPARLSDGEFVFTAEAVKVIGADNLMAMMKDAESQAQGRQDLAEGGMPEEETVTMKVQEQKEPKVQIAKTTVNSTKGLLDEDEISKGIKSKMMLDPLQRHVRS